MVAAPSRPEPSGRDREHRIRLALSCVEGLTGLPASTLEGLAGAFLFGRLARNITRAAGQCSVCVDRLFARERRSFHSLRQ